MALVLCAGAVGACGGDSSSSSGGETEPVKLGFIVDQTGALAPIGESYTRGFDAAIDLWNSTSGRRKVEVESCDSQSTGAGALSCYQRLHGSVDALSGPHLFLGVASVKDVAAQGNVALMSGAPLVDPAPDTAVFQSVPSVADGVKAGLEYLSDEGLTRVAVLTSNDQPGNLANAAAKRLAPSLGLELVRNEVFDPTAQSLAAQAENIGRSDPDAVLAWTAGPQLITALRALSAARVDVPVMLNYASMSTTLLAQAGPAAGDNLLFFGTAAFDPSAIEEAGYRKRVEDYRAAFERKYDQVPDFAAYTAGDTGRILAEAGSAEGSSDILDTLNGGGSWSGVLFPSYRFSESRHIGGVGSQAFRILRWQPEKRGWALVD